MAIAEYIEVFCNRQRSQSSLEYRLPVQAWIDHKELTVQAFTDAA